MGAAKRRSPTVMPDSARADGASEGLAKPMVVAGSRSAHGTPAARSPKHEVHGVHRTAGTRTLDDAGGKHAIIFVHGYNVTASQSLESSRDFFGKLQTSLDEDGHDLGSFAYVAFTWPGDVGPLWFSDAQRFAQESGVALYQMTRDLMEQHGATRITLFTHSLGAHVGLRAAAIMGERRFSKKTTTRFDNLILLAAAVENDVFERPDRAEEYHFPDSPFGVGSLHMVTSRGDEVLGSAFLVSEMDRALGFSGPETMNPLVSMARRVTEVIPPPTNSFSFQLHDFSPRSTTILNPALHAHDHGDYWSRQDQVDYYVNLVR